MTKKTSILHITAQIGDTVQIGNTCIRIEEKSGRRVRLGVMSSHKVTVFKNPSAQECPNETLKGENHGTDQYFNVISPCS